MNAVTTNNQVDYDLGAPTGQGVHVAGPDATAARRVISWLLSTDRAQYGVVGARLTPPIRRRLGPENPRSGIKRCHLDAVC